METFTGCVRPGWHLPSSGVAKRKGGGSRGAAAQLLVSTLAYFRLAIAVRSNLPATTKDAAPVQAEPTGIDRVTA
jgi:hypothetical protein